MLNFKKVLKFSFIPLTISISLIFTSTTLYSFHNSGDCLRVPLASNERLASRREFLALLVGGNRLIQAEKQLAEFNKIADKFRAIYASIEAKALDQKRHEQELRRMLVGLRSELEAKGLLKTGCPFLESLVTKLDLEGNIFQDIESSKKPKDKKTKQILRKELTLCAAKSQAAFNLLNSIEVKNVKAVASKNHSSVTIELGNSRYLIVDFTINMFEIIILSDSEDSHYRKRGGYWFLKDEYKIPNERLSAIKRELDDTGTVKGPLTQDEIWNAWYPFIYITDSPKGTELSMRLKRGFTYHESGFLGKAKREYEAGLSLDPDYAELYNNVGAIFRDFNMWSEALSLFKRAVGLNPENASAQCNLGTAYAAFGDWENALKSQEEALRVDPGLIIAYGNLADATVNLGETYESQDRLEEANNKYSEAIEQYKKAIKFMPNDPALYLGLGLAYFRLKMYTEAMKEFDTVNRSNKDWWEPYYFYGMICYEKGEREEAIRFFEQALMLHPDTNKYISKLPKDEALREYMRRKAQQTGRLRLNQALQYMGAHSVLSSL